MEKVFDIPREFCGQRLSAAFAFLGIPFSMPCGAAGRCGKCRVRLLDGEVSDKDGRAVLPDHEGFVHACRVFVGESGCRVSIFVQDALSFENREDHHEKERLGIALDIGTTTLVAALVSLDSGRVLAYRSMLNPQSVYGADVMSRIENAKQGRLAELSACLLKAIRTLTVELLGAGNVADELFVVGNATMLHFFLGISPEGMGQYPFVPAFLNTRRLSGADLQLPVLRVTVLPSASAFIGSDVLAGVYWLGLENADKPAVLLDLGTNGEAVLSSGGKLFALSAAAGPAFEGGEISMGLGGVSGAISRIEKQGDMLTYTTVGDLAPRGITGAALCDLTALLLANGTIEQSGYLASPYRLSGAHLKGNSLASPSPTAVVITPSDIRKLQLAKAAVAAGISLLLSEGGADFSTLDAFYLAGGFGFYLASDSAKAIGLLPASARVTALGNTALQGAVKAMLDESPIEALEAIAKRVELISLAEHPDFAKAFTDAISF